MKKFKPLTLLNVYDLRPGYYLKSHDSLKVQNARIFTAVYIYIHTYNIYIYIYMYVCMYITKEKKTLAIRLQTKANQPPRNKVRVPLGLDCSTSHGTLM